MAQNTRKDGKPDMFKEFSNYRYMPRDMKGGRFVDTMIDPALLEMATIAQRDQDEATYRRLMEVMRKQSEGAIDFGYARKVEIDPNSPDGIAQLEANAAAHGLNRPFILCMTQRTWSEFISRDAKEYIVQQMDACELEVKITNEAPDKAIYLQGTD